MRATRWVGVLVAVLLAGSCDPYTGPRQGVGSGPVGGRSDSVRLRLSVFRPTPDTVAAGTQVLWVNRDAVVHTVTSDSTSLVVFDDTLAAAESTLVTFADPGTFSYFCRIHGTPTTGMRGVIVVE